MVDSSRKRAQTWQYPRHQDFERSLQAAAAAWFADKGFLVHSKYRYILADLEHWAQNIIVPEVADYVVAERARRQSKRIGFPLHKYAHHGLSSQALLFNLVGPLDRAESFGASQAQRWILAEFPGRQAQLLLRSSTKIERYSMRILVNRHRLI